MRAMLVDNANYDFNFFIYYQNGRVSIHINTMVYPIKVSGCRLKTVKLLP